MKEIKDLTARYGLSEQGLRKFIREHLSELNSGGEHVKRVGRSWQLDDTAIQRLDKLRRVETVELIVTDDTSSRLAKLNETNAALLAKNVDLMRSLVDAQKEIIRLQRELLSAKDAATRPQNDTHDTPTKFSFVSEILRKIFG